MRHYFIDLDKIWKFYPWCRYQCLMVNRMSLIAHCGKAKFCQCHFVIHLASAHTHSFPKAKVQRCTVDEMHLFVTGLIFLLCQKRIDMLFALTFLLAKLCQNANFLLIWKNYKLSFKHWLLDNGWNFQFFSKMIK